MGVMDAISLDPIHLINLIYLPLVLYKVIKIMDTNQAKLANSLFSALTIFFTILGIYVYLTGHVVASKDAQIESTYSFPLYEPK